MVCVCVFVCDAAMAQAKSRRDLVLARAALSRLRRGGGGSRDPYPPLPPSSPNPTPASYLHGSFPHRKLGVGAGSCQPRACFGAESCEDRNAEEAWL